MVLRPSQGAYLEAFETIWGRFWSDNGVGVGNSGFSKIFEKTMVFEWFSVVGVWLGTSRMRLLADFCRSKL